LEYNRCSVPTYLPNETYIVGGKEVIPNSLPWYVSIQYEEEHICSGTLIDDRHILTSASCFQKSFIPIPYSVVLGAHDLSNSIRRISIDRFIFHSDYNVKTSENNIGLIRLSERIQSFSDYITPACLFRSIRLPNISNTLIVAGWRTMEIGKCSVRITNELRQTILTAMDDCSGVDPKYDFKKQLCVGRKDSNCDLCQGDSGSGLFEKQKHDTDRWILTGIVSCGCENASQCYPGVYTRVSAYYDWIQNTIEQMNKEKMK
jgi:secreted trypsin-like serine protease